MIGAPKGASTTGSIRVRVHVLAKIGVGDPALVPGKSLCQQHGIEQGHVAGVRDGTDVQQGVGG